MKAKRHNSDHADAVLLGAAVVVLLLLSIGERALTRPFATPSSTAAAGTVRINPFDRTVSVSRGNLGSAVARDDESRRRVLADFVASHADYFRLRGGAERHLSPAADDASLYVDAGAPPLILVTLRSDCAPSSHATVIAGAFDSRSGELRMVSGGMDGIDCGVVVADGGGARERAAHSAGSVRLGL